MDFAIACCPASGQPEVAENYSELVENMVAVLVGKSFAGFEVDCCNSADFEVAVGLCRVAGLVVVADFASIKRFITRRRI